MLDSALKQYEQQQRLSAAGLVQARRVAGRGSRAVAVVLTRYQLAAIALALESAPRTLSEQGLSPAAEGRVVAEALVTGGGATDLFDKASSDAAFDRLVLALINDAGRTAQSVDLATRPAVSGYVRSLRPPSCGRCAVLAGRVYRFSQGFRRHPQCDCLMTPTSDTIGPSLVTNVGALVSVGHIRGLSQADAAAVNDGADLGRVVNVQRKEAGLMVGSSVLERSGRPTPAGIYRVASDKADALRLFRRFGYVI